MAKNWGRARVATAAAADCVRAALQPRFAFLCLKVTCLALKKQRLLFKTQTLLQRRAAAEERAALRRERGEAERKAALRTELRRLLRYSCDRVGCLAAAGASANCAAERGRSC